MFTNMYVTSLVPRPSTHLCFLWEQVEGLGTRLVRHKNSLLSIFITLYVGKLVLSFVC